MSKLRENWKSSTGAILAVAGGAIGLGNFLRFPSQVVEYGGGAFMIAYGLSFLLIGLPLCWMEWSVGRLGGAYGYSSAPSIYNILWRHPLARYLGGVCVVIVLAIFMYYTYVEAWCLGYAIHYLIGDVALSSVEESKSFWASFVGLHENGSGMTFSFDTVGVFLLIVFVVNFYLIYRGISRGIELFCKAAMPAMFVMAFIILVRVLTLGIPDSSRPENNIINGLGFMWNPSKTYLQENHYSGWGKHAQELRLNLEQGIAVVPSLRGDGYRWLDKSIIWGDDMREQATSTVLERKIERATFQQQYGDMMPAMAHAYMEKTMPQMRLDNRTLWQELLRPGVWLAAASQVFFSLSVGFGAILTYASYMKRKDDIALSCLTAASANEFCEVVLGGLITVPAGFLFLGASGVSGQGAFALGFHVLPIVFSNMPLGDFFGFLFFFLLFLAAVASTLSLLQPGIAFLEETLHIKRKLSVAILAGITVLGGLFVAYYSKDAKALDTLDFWVGSFMIFSVAMIGSIVFSRKLGISALVNELHLGASIRISRFFIFCMQYVSPVLLAIIFGMWILIDVMGVGVGDLNYHVTDLIGIQDTPPSIVAWMSVGLIFILVSLISFMISRTEHFDALHNPSRKGKEI